MCSDISKSLDITISLQSEISSDRGTQFTSKLRTTGSQLLGMKHSRTPLCHPQSNELVRRFHRHLKSALRARLTGPSQINELPWVLCGIRTVVVMCVGFGDWGIVLLSCNGVFQ